MNSVILAPAVLLALLALLGWLVRKRWAPLDVLHTHGLAWPARLLRHMGCISYAQDGQDLAVLRILGENRPGFFVEAGASNGVISSNTCLLESRHGWTGICVEADPWFFEQLRRNRSCICVPACLDGENARIAFTPAGATGGIVAGDTDNHVPQDDRMLTLETRRLQDVLDAHRAPSVIDFLSLDVEGAEWRILRHFPFDRYSFRLMMIERPSALLHAHLLSCGYRHVGEAGGDEIYCHGGEPSLVARAAEILQGAGRD